jgi:hypothetical protein
MVSQQLSGGPRNGARGLGLGRDYELAHVEDGYSGVVFSPMNKNSIIGGAAKRHR